MSREATKRDVLQLLWEYQTWKAAFGGALPWDEQHIAQAAYGPASYIFEGAAYVGEYTPDQIKRLAESYRALDDVLDILKGDGPLGFTAWTVLHSAYLRPDADPSVVDRWREWVVLWQETRERLEREDEQAFIEWMGRRPDSGAETRKWRERRPAWKVAKWLRTHPKPQNAEWHDLAVGQCAHYLREVKLYPIEPKRLSESEDKSIENKNAEMYADFQRLRASGMGEREAAAQAAKVQDVSVEYVLGLLEFRDTLRPKTCIESGCDRAVYAQNRCSRHYQQDLKRRKGKAS